MTLPAVLQCLTVGALTGFLLGLLCPELLRILFLPLKHNG